MNFIERWFGLSPDGGNGLTEAALIFALGAVLIGLVVVGRRRRRWRH